MPVETGKLLELFGTEKRWITDWENTGDEPVLKGLSLSEEATAQNLVLGIYSTKGSNGVMFVWAIAGR